MQLYGGLVQPDYLDAADKLAQFFPTVIGGFEGIGIILKLGSRRYS